VRRSQTWQVTLDVDGRRQTENITVTVESFAQASAEVKATKAAEAAGAKRVRCLHSRFISEAPDVG
jgi:hypothetical protein